MKKLVKVTRPLGLAVQAGQTVLEQCREAARAAATQAAKAKTVAENHEAISALYADELSKDNNVRANFRDMLLLVLAADAPVSIQQKSGELHTTASEAVKLAKHSMKDAAKAVREDLGIGRAAGGGRKPRQPEAPKAAAKPAPLAPIALADAVCDNITDGAFVEALADAMLDRLKLKRSEALIEQLLDLLIEKAKK